MMKENRLTADQVRLLAPYERNFRQATEAAWCSYPGQAGINQMLDVWTSLTGSQYPYRAGCPNCLLNLVRDIGTIYFAQKDEVLAEETAVKADNKPAEAVTEKKPGKAPAKKKNARKTK